MTCIEANILPAPFSSPGSSSHKTQKLRAPPSQRKANLTEKRKRCPPELSVLSDLVLFVCVFKSVSAERFLDIA